MLFSLLGPMRVDAAAGAAPGGARLRVLLAALLLHANTPVAAEALAEAVWDGSPPAGAVDTLRSYVQRLRRTLGPEAGARIATRAPGYLINVSESELDVRQFEALCNQASSLLGGGAWDQAAAAAARALELWRGVPLLDVPSQGLRDAFVPRLERLRVRALEERIEADLHLGRHESLVPELYDVLADHPLHERLHAQLMLALARCGRQAEALAVYRETRRVLIAELGIEPGTELRIVHARILAGEVESAAPQSEPQPKPVQAKAAVAAVVPRQLPAAPRNFTGRHAELEAVVRLVGGRDRGLAPGGAVVISAIDGMAGIGKTALAVHAAHRLAPQFPDGQLFIDLHGYSRDLAPRSVEEALDVFLRALDVPPQRIPPDVEARAALYRECLAEARTLIVLDNAVDEEQVRPLIPAGPGCLVIVTSRRRLKSLDDAHVVALDVLTAEDAIALMRAVAGPERATDDVLLGEIAELCGRLPLALRIAAALLRHRPSWPLRHLADKLRAARGDLSAFSDGERDLTSVLDLSLRTLAEGQRLLFRRLGVSPGPDIGVRAAAAVADLDPDACEPLLQSLVDHNLLAEPAAGRYRLHDLVRLHARALAAADPADERDAALQRLLDYYQRTAQHAEAQIARHGAAPAADPKAESTSVARDPETARAWLRLERANLLACIDQADTDGRDDRVVALAAALATLLRTDGPWTQAVSLHAAAAKAAERAGDRPGLATALTHLGGVLRMTGAYPDAVGALEQAIEIHGGLDDRIGQAAALSELGGVRRMTGDHPGSIRDVEQALGLYSALGDGAGQASTLVELGVGRYLISDLAGAVDALNRALELHRALGDRLGQATALTYLGGMRRAAGDYSAAMNDIEQALELQRELGNPHGQATALGELGCVRWNLRDYRGAIGDMLAAIEIFRQLGSLMGEATTLVTLGAARRDDGDHAGAARDLSRALEVFRSVGARGNEAWALNHYAGVFVASGEIERAVALYREALEIALHKSVPEEEALALEGIGVCLVRTGDVDGAATHLDQALRIFRRLNHPDAKRIEERLEQLAGNRH